MNLEPITPEGACRAYRCGKDAWIIEQYRASYTAFRELAGCAWETVTFADSQESAWQLAEQYSHDGRIYS